MKTTAQGTRKITSVKIVYRGKEIPAKVVDTGDADMEVHSGDWAIIKTRDLDLPRAARRRGIRLRLRGTDLPARQRLLEGHHPLDRLRRPAHANGLVTCLTDGHPGVSGGGVLDQRGVLVGIPIGRMQGDYRFSFILPIRAEMLRKLPTTNSPNRRWLPSPNNRKRPVPPKRKARRRTGRAEAHNCRRVKAGSATPEAAGSSPSRPRHCQQQHGRGAHQPDPHRSVLLPETSARLHATPAYPPVYVSNRGVSQGAPCRHPVL